MRLSTLLRHLQILGALCGAYTVFDAYGEIVDFSMFGNCAVYNDVDDFTDEVMPALRCKTGKASIAIARLSKEQASRGHGTWMVIVKSGVIELRIEETVPVLLRIDKHEVFTWNHAFWDSRNIQAIHSLNDETAARLLTEISVGARLMIKVGTSRAAIELSGSAEAIEEFSRRVNLVRDTELPG